MRLDLHLHSTASDGSVSPTAVAEAAAAGGLDVIALTDHDTVAGVEAARAAGRVRSVEVISGVEVSSTWEGEEVHILGYFVDVGHPAMVEHGGRAGRLREARIRGMLERLEDQGVTVPMSAVLEAAGPERHSLGRPHLARALQAAGYVASVPEAFDRLIGDDHPAFLPTRFLEPTEAVTIILEAGGLPVWAHPPGELLDALLPRLCRGGLRGLEVYRPRLGPERILRLERAARSAGLLVTGGSDWHGPESGELGAFSVSEDEVGAFLEAGGL